MYTQKQGTAIGTKSAPTYCGIFMGDLEEDMLEMWMNLGPSSWPDDWLRFIDDCLFWWTGTPGDLLIFINFVNNFHPDIKFTCDYSFATKSVEFLDLVIFVDEDGFIQTDLHTKQNAKNSYLLPTSNHPGHICRNIPYSLAFRIMRNCSKKELCEKRFEELSVKLVDRGYRKRVVEQAIKKVRDLKREDILKKVDREDKNKSRVRAVIRFDRRLPNICSILRKNWQTMIGYDSRMLKIFPEPPMVCFTRGKNLREEVCKAKLPPARMGRPIENGFRRCSRAKCRLCPYTNLRHGQVLKSVTISNTGEELPIKGSITCTTSNIIYVGTCAKGDKTCPTRPQYCGETGKSAEERFCGHRNSIIQACQDNTTLPVGEHFRGVRHCLPDFVFTPVEKITSRNVFVRKAREKMIINKYDLIDRGLNKRL